MSLAGDDKQEEVQAASTAEEMWKAIGKDSWVVVPIASTSRPGTPCCASTALTRPSDQMTTSMMPVFKFIGLCLLGTCQVYANWL